MLLESSELAQISPTAVSAVRQHTFMGFGGLAPEGGSRGYFQNFRFLAIGQ